uniref:Uncharacterized protein n=1 Tax=Angiostrongylus cantonensis TaxID=6313 RepID=A0A0K0DI41_ANGCA
MSNSVESSCCATAQRRNSTQAFRKETGKPVGFGRKRIGLEVVIDFLWAYSPSDDSIYTPDDNKFGLVFDE